jgi:non-heme chloroperoxidase
MLPGRPGPARSHRLVPIANSAYLTAKAIPKARLTVYEGGAHGMCSTEKNRVNEDLLAFFRE